MLPRHRQFGLYAFRVQYRILQLLYIRCLDRGLGVVTSSEVSRSDLHLGAFDGVLSAFPGDPVHALTHRRVMSMLVQAVQVGVVAPVVPPDAFAPDPAGTEWTDWSLPRSLVLKDMLLCLGASESPAVPDEIISPVVELYHHVDVEFTSAINSCL